MHVSESAVLALDLLWMLAFFGLVCWHESKLPKHFSLSGLNSPHEQWRRENGQRYCLATMAKDTDCPGWRDEMTFLWKQEQHNLNEFCWVEREHVTHMPYEVEREANTGSQIKESKLKDNWGEGLSSEWQKVLKAAYLWNCGTMKEMEMIACLHQWVEFLLVDLE